MPSGILGDAPSAGTLQIGQGAPPPQEHAWRHCHGLSGWLSHTQPLFTHHTHFIDHTRRSGSESPATGPGERKYTLEMKVKFWSNRREPSIRSNTVSLPDGKGERDLVPHFALWN
jgi:hypothetical protein